MRLFRAARPERITFRRVYRQAPEPSYAQLSEPESREPSLVASAVRLPSRPREDETRGEPQPVLPIAPAAPAPPSLAPVERAAVRKDTGEMVPTASLVKDFEYEKNRYVGVTPKGLKAIAAKAVTQMEIQECVRSSEIDPVHFETSYYVSPEEAGEKAYALLYAALRKTGLVALAQFAMRDREHVVLLRPGRKGYLRIQCITRPRFGRKMSILPKLVL